MVDAFVRRQQDLEESATSEINRRQELEDHVERLSLEVEELRAEKLKLSDCLEGERFTHSKTVEALGKASSELLKKTELLETEQKARVAAEGRSTELDEVVGAQKQKIENLELQLESEKHVTDMASQELANLR